ncbi:MAG: hypothetical protein KC933_37775, partial [Myxococcales bacterium]|nr:hypothetical protein [Myxococcales bacterium]
AGLDADVHVGPVVVRPRVGARYALSAGELGSEAWFPEARAWGFDGELALAWAFTRWLTFDARGALTRYHLDLDPAVGAARVAGGAVDQYWSVFAGATFLLAGR